MFDELTKEELVKLAKENGLAVYGTKADLIERLEKGGVKIGVEKEEKAEVVEEEVKTVVDAMPSEVSDILAEARSHYIGTGSVSGSYIFDNVPGQITAGSLEDALETHRTMPGNLKTPNAH